MAANLNEKVNLTYPIQEAAIATVKIVFPSPAFQLLYSAHAKRAEHARSQTENEWFGWWPVSAEPG